MFSASKTATLILINRTYYNISLPLSDLSHDIRPGECSGSNSESDWDDAPALSLGRLSSVHGAHAAGVPFKLLGI